MKRIRGTSSIDEGTPIMSHWIKIEHVYLYIPNRSVGGSTFQKVNRTYFDPFYEPPPRGKVWSLQSFHAVRRRHVWSFTGFWRALGIRELPKIKPCPSLCCSATSCTCCSCSLLKILTTVARMHKKKKSSCNFGFSTHDSFRKKNMLLFRKQLSCLLGHSWTSKKKATLPELPSHTIPQPLGEEPIPALPMGPEEESYHELPSPESLQRFAKRVYCCVPFLLLSLVPFVLFYCIVAKAFCFCNQKIPGVFGNHEPSKTHGKIRVLAT